jgi:hypothetical protein
MQRVPERASSRWKAGVAIGRYVRLSQVQLWRVTPTPKIGPLRCATSAWVPRAVSARNAKAFRFSWWKTGRAGCTQAVKQVPASSQRRLHPARQVSGLE